MCSECKRLEVEFDRLRPGTMLVAKTSFSGKPERGPRKQTVAGSSYEVLRLQKNPGVAFHYLWVTMAVEQDSTSLTGARGTENGFAMCLAGEIFNFQSPISTVEEKRKLILDAFGFSSEAELEEFLKQ